MKVTRVAFISRSGVIWLMWWHERKWTENNWRFHKKVCIGQMDLAIYPFYNQNIHTMQDRCKTKQPSPCTKAILSVREFWVNFKNIANKKPSLKFFLYRVNKSPWDLETWIFTWNFLSDMGPSALEIFQLIGQRSRMIHTYLIMQMEVIVKKYVGFRLKRKLLLNTMLNSLYMPHLKPWDIVTSSNRTIFCVTGTKASDAELWCFLWSAPEYTIE